MTQRIVILGAGGNAYDLLDTIDAMQRVEERWSVLGILDDRRDPGSTYLGVPVLGSLNTAINWEGCLFASTIWNEATFRNLHKIIARVGVESSRFATLIHPAAGVSPRARLGRGVNVHYGASVAGNVEIGDFVSLGPACVVGHDARIESFTTVAAGALMGGGVHVGSNCYIGSGALIRQQLKIGAGALIGMGAVVVKDVDPGATVVGNPARPLGVGQYQDARR